MGQYYKPTNLDKGQFLYTHSLGDGLKLLEFGLSSCGTMTAMALLLSDGNGRGGGDLLLPDKTAKNKKLLALANEIIGSWAGDRIVIAGDYGDSKKFINRRKYKAPLLQQVADNHYNEAYAKASRVNIYALAEDHFEDISWKVLAVMCIDSYILETMTEHYNKELGYNNDDGPFVKAFVEAAKVNPEMAEVVANKYQVTSPD